MSERFNNIYRIDSARLRRWDYRNPGFYFVTINTRNRDAYFSGNIDVEIILNDTGLIARECWMRIPAHFPHVEIDEFIVMPDHVHGIVIITERICREKNDDSDIHKPAAGSLSAIIRSYKSAVTKQCHETGHAQFAWQARFYDRVIRDEEELHYTRKYIRDNPANYMRGMTVKSC